MFKQKHILCKISDDGTPTGGSEIDKTQHSQQENTMFKQKNILCEAFADDGGAGGSSASTKPRKAKRRTEASRKNLKSTPEGRLPTNIVKLKSGLEVTLNPGNPKAYKGDVPLLDSITLGQNVNHLGEVDMADLISQVGAKSVTLHSESRFQDLSFLPENVQYLDASKCKLENIANYVNAPSTLHTINVSSKVGSLKFSKLKELIDMKVSFDLEVSRVLMENGAQVRLDLNILQGVISKVKSNVVFENVNTEEDQAAYEGLLSFIGRFTITSLTLEDSLQPAGLINLPASLKELQIKNCPSLDVQLNIAKKSALRHVKISNVHSVVQISSVNVLDELNISNCTDVTIDKTTRAKVVRVTAVRVPVNIQSLDDKVVERLVLEQASNLPTFQEENADYATRLEVSLQALTLEQFKEVLALPLKLDLTMSRMTISGDVIIPVGIEVQDGEIVKKTNELSVSGLKSKVQLKEVENIVNYFKGIHKLKVYDSPVVDTISSADFNQQELIISGCKNLRVDEKIPKESQLTSIEIANSGQVINLDTSALQDVAVIQIENTPTIVTPGLAAYELRLKCTDLTIKGKESFSQSIRKIWISRYRGISAHSDYEAVDAPADVLAKIPDYLQHNLKASALDRSLEVAGRIVEGVKRVKWDKLPSAIQEAAKLLGHKISNSSAVKYLAHSQLGEKAKKVLPASLSSIDINTKDGITVQYESIAEKEIRLKALEDNSKKSSSE